MADINKEYQQALSKVNKRKAKSSMIVIITIVVIVILAAIGFGKYSNDKTNKGYYERYQSYYNQGDYQSAINQVKLLSDSYYDKYDGDSLIQDCKQQYANQLLNTLENLKQSDDKYWLLRTINELSDEYRQNEQVQQYYDEAVIPFRQEVLSTASWYYANEGLQPTLDHLNWGLEALPDDELILQAIDEYLAQQ